VLVRREEDAPEGTARLVFTCRSRWRTWQVVGQSGVKDPRRSSKSPLSEVRSRPSVINHIDRAPTWTAGRSFCSSFHQALLGPTAAHWLDDPPDLTCKDSTRLHAVDDSRLFCNPVRASG
jgi:hypothetical protein